MKDKTGVKCPLILKKPDLVSWICKIKTKLSENSCEEVIYSEWSFFMEQPNVINKK